ncbi:hypothetical protein GQ600_10705 [Phytophthora cactorum]|nr:hypothetical protein GQ600_10705 [Phytophthora cactorum]
MLLESIKTYVVSKSALTPCSLYKDPSPHNMRTRLFLCKCSTCKTIALSISGQGAAVHYI